MSLQLAILFSLFEYDIDNSFIIIIIIANCFLFALFSFDSFF
jgi:hypothetical protein